MATNIPDAIPTIREVITAITKNPTHAYCAVTTIYQFRFYTSIHARYILFFFSKEKGRHIPNP